MSPLKELPAKEDDVLTSTPQKQSKQVPPLTGGEGSPSGTTMTPPSTPTKTPLHRRLSRHSSYGYRQVCDFQKGDSRKYPYHTTGGILEFRGRGGFLGLKFRRQKGGGG